MDPSELPFLANLAIVCREWATFCAFWMVIVYGLSILSSLQDIVAQKAQEMRK